MAPAMTAIFFKFQFVRSAAFILGGTVILTFASLTNKLNNFSGHCFNLKNTDDKRGDNSLGLLYLYFIIPKFR
jgi:hypothetical protein